MPAGDRGRLATAAGHSGEGDRLVARPYRDPGDGYRFGPLQTTGAMVPTDAPSASRVILVRQSVMTATVTVTRVPTFI